MSNTPTKRFKDRGSSLNKAHQKKQQKNAFFSNTPDEQAAGLNQHHGSGLIQQLESIKMHKNRQKEHLFKKSRSQVSCIKSSLNLDRKHQNILLKIKTGLIGVLEVVDTILNKMNLSKKLGLSQGLDDCNPGKSTPSPFKASPNLGFPPKNSLNLL